MREIKISTYNREKRKTIKKEVFLFFHTLGIKNFLIKELSDGMRIWIDNSVARLFINRFSKKYKLLEIEGV